MWSRVVCAVVVMVVLVGPAGCRKSKTKKRGHKIPKLVSLACQITTTDGDVTTKTCGCDGEDDVICDMGPLELPKYGIADARYCNIPVDPTSDRPYKGLLKSACLIQSAVEGSVEIFKYDPCETTRDGAEVTCDLGPLPVKIDGEDARAFFCNKNRKVNIEDIDDQETCVKLDKGRSAKRKKKKKVPKLIQQACHMTTDDGEVLTKDCGCEGDDPVPCDLGPLALPPYGVTAAMYCNIAVDMDTVNPFKGVLMSACLIRNADDDSSEIFKYDVCKPMWDGAEVTCDLGPLPVVVDGKDAHAYFCNKNVNEDIEHMKTETTCIELNKSRDGRKGKGAKLTTGETKGNSKKKQKKKKKRNKVKGSRKGQKEKGVKKGKENKKGQKERGRKKQTERIGNGRKKG